MSAQTRVASNHSLGNDVKMAEKPDVIVSIDLGTTYTGKKRFHSNFEMCMTLTMALRCCMDDSKDTNPGRQ